MCSVSVRRESSLAVSNQCSVCVCARVRAVHMYVWGVLWQCQISGVCACVLCCVYVCVCVRVSVLCVCVRSSLTMSNKMSVCACVRSDTFAWSEYRKCIVYEYNIDICCLDCIKLVYWLPTILLTEDTFR